MSTLPSTSPRTLVSLQQQNARAEELLVSNPREALALAQRAYDAGCAQNVCDTLARSLWVQGIALGLLEEMDQSDAVLAEAIRRAVECGQPDVQYRAINGLGANAHRRGEYGKAFSQYHRYLSYARQAQDPTAEARALGNIGLLFQEMGEVGRSLEIAEQVLAIGCALERPLLCVVSATNIAEAELGRGEYAAALAVAVRWREVARSEGFQIQDALLLAIGGAAKLGLGRSDEALADLEAAVTRGRQLGDFHEICGPLVSLGEAYHAAGRHTEALAVLNEAFERCGRADSLALQAKASRVLLSLHQALGQFEEALRHAHTVLRLQEHVHGERLSRRTEVLAVEFEIDQLRSQAELERQKMEVLQESNALLHRLQENLQHEATHDPLTGLYNRRYFLQLLDANLVESGSAGQRFSIAYLDLDGFKEVNDTHGHPAGDALLTEIAHRVLAQTDPADVVARLGGDEFAIIMKHTGLREEVERKALRVVDAICRPHTWGAVNLECSVSLGLAEFPEHGTTAAELLHEADAAMYLRKRRGRRTRNARTREDAR